VNSKPLIGILVSNKKVKPGSYFLYNQSRANLFCFTSHGINWSNKTILGRYLENDVWKQKTFPFPDAVYNRCYNKKKTKVIKRIGRIIGRQKVFNMFNRFDKWEIYQILNNTVLENHLPNTCLCHDVNLVDSLESNQQIILKPRYGLLGRNIYSIERHANNDLYLYRQTIRPHQVFKDQQNLLRKIFRLIDCNKYIAQKKIKMVDVEGRFFDIRTLVQKNKHDRWEVSGALCRIAVKNFYITNVSHAIKPVEDTLLQSECHQPKLIEEINKISIEIAKQLESKLKGIGEIGVDLCLDHEGKLWILEVNGKPMKGLFRQLGDEEMMKTIFSRPIEYGVFLSKKTK